MLVAGSSSVLEHAVKMIDNSNNILIFPPSISSFRTLLAMEKSRFLVATLCREDEQKKDARLRRASPREDLSTAKESNMARIVADAGRIFCNW